MTRRSGDAKGRLVECRHGDWTSFGRNSVGRRPSLAHAKGARMAKLQQLLHGIIMALSKRKSNPKSF
jgi:hypothetical protein